MANSLRRLELSREDAPGESIEDIDSSEEEAVETTVLDNQENTIEECEEPKQPTDKGCHSRQSYPPLEVRRRRIKNAKSSVNNARTFSLDRKTVLYGQTPMTVRRKQLQAMAEHSGLSMKEIAEKIMSRNSSENLDLLRQFHTHIDPQLSSVFEDLKNSTSFVPEKSGSQRGKRVERREPRAVVSQPQVDPSIQEFIVSDEGYEPDADLFSQSSTDYSNIPTVPVHEMEELSTTGNRRKQIKRTKNSTSESMKRKSCKTVVSETDSDSSEGSLSPSRLHNNENLSHCPWSIDSTRADKTISETTDTSTCQRSPIHTASSNVYDALFSTANTASVENSKESVDDKFGGKYYNSFLDDLLFNDKPNPQPSGSRTIDNRSEGLNNQKMYTRESQNNRTSSSECTNVRSFDHQPVQVRPHSGCYNRVLEGLLFEDVSNSLVLRDRINEPAHGSDDRDDSRTKTHPDNPTSGEKDSDAKSILRDFFDEALDNSAESYKENVSPRVKKKSDNVKEHDVNSKTENEESKVLPLPSSLELNNSLWNTLDASLEY